jgi:biopolymer transport protein ExbD
MKLERKFRLQAGIDPVPVINLFFLAFFFYLLYPVTVKSPVYNTEQYTNRDIGSSEALINLNKSGLVFINGSRVTMDSLGMRIKEMVISNGNITVIINGEPEVPYGRIMETLNIARLSGAKNIKLISSNGY